MNFRLFGFIVTIALLLAALSYSSTSAAPSAKGKPPKNPTATPTPGGGGCPDLGGGSIYYADANDVVHELDADCGTDSALPAVPAYSLRPSKQRHNGLRWFLRSEVEAGVPPDPNGRQARELWAYSETGTGVQLTDYTQGGSTPSDTFVYDGGLQWAPDDGFVSWVGGHWVDDDGDGTLDRMDAVGIYRADLTYDSDGNVSGLATPRPALPTVLIDTSVSGLPIYRHAWSPDASRLAYGRSYQLYRVDTIPNSNPGSHVLLGTGDVPDWSSSDRIAYNTTQRNRRKVLSIDPDGSNSVQLASARNSLVGFPWWSPTGSHVVYVSDPCCPFDTYRVMSSGSGKTLLVPNGDAIGWVAED